MDTKSKKWRAAVSFAAFFLAVSLLLPAVPDLIFLLTDGEYGRQTVRDAFAADYQDTAAFREAISGYLEQFIGMAVGRPASASYSVTVQDQAVRGTADSAQWSGMDEQAQREWEEKMAAEYAAMDNAATYIINSGTWDMDPDELHRSLKDERNVLYQIRYGGDLLYTNAEGLGLDGPSGTLPEGYNFLLYFDGEKTHIFQNGGWQDIYGDGYYREGSGWYVPGYKNFTVDEGTARATVCIAVAEEPVFYQKSSYATHRSEQQENRLFWLKSNLEQQRRSYLISATSLAAGAVLLAVYLRFLRDGKRLADRALAGATGRVWFEPKLALLLLVLSMLLLSPADTLLEIHYLILESGFLDPGLIPYYFREMGGRTAALLAAFWVSYLFVNDLRYNQAPWRHGLCGKLGSAMRASDLELPFQQRMVRRYRRVLAAGLVLALTAAACLTLCMLEFGGAPSARLAVLLAGVLSIALLFWGQYRFALMNRAAARDVGALVDQIASIRDGNLTRPLELPEDGDLARAADGLDDIQRGMHTALEEQIKSERLKVELISNVSHDIKTPLTSIISYVELLNQEEDLPAHVRDYVRILGQKSRRLKEMVQDVFEVSKAASGQLPVELEELDLAKLLRQTLADMAEHIEQSPVLLRAELPEAPVIVTADGQRLYRVFQNLIQNALQYSLEGSRVYLTLRADRVDAVASIKNTSRQEIADGVDFTERFVRGDQSRTDGGSGLGLSIASSFTEACGGALTVETVADLFVVTVRLPLSDDPDPAGLADGRSDPGGPEAPEDGNPPDAGAEAE